MDAAPRRRRRRAQRVRPGRRVGRPAGGGDHRHQRQDHGDRAGRRHAGASGVAAVDRRQHRRAAGRGDRRSGARRVRGRGVVVPARPQPTVRPDGGDLAELRARPPRRARVARRLRAGQGAHLARPVGRRDVAVANRDDPIVWSHANGPGARRDVRPGRARRRRTRLRARGRRARRPRAATSIVRVDELGRSLPHDVANALAAVGHRARSRRRPLDARARRAASASAGWPTASSWSASATGCGGSTTRRRRSPMRSRPRWEASPPWCSSPVDGTRASTCRCSASWRRRSAPWSPSASRRPRSSAAFGVDAAPAPPRSMDDAVDAAAVARDARRRGACCRRGARRSTGTRATRRGATTSPASVRSPGAAIGRDPAT